jgi:hypothetical protein
LDKDFIRRIFTKFRRLKVLEFETSSPHNIIVHENWGSLINLKYLSFKTLDMEVREGVLPKSIRMLQNLETLDLGWTHSYEIPKEVSKLIESYAIFWASECLCFN